MQENVAEGKIEIDIPEVDEWVERIGTAYAMCNNSRIKLKTEASQRTGFVIESNDSAALGCIGWAIEKYLDEIPSQLKPTFQKILDIRIKKENLERS